eukprot:TRINITY_DN16145_c0_g1_i2.p1 TRINITY_DN16145_c0_g1~~TRINITY_DN16145_c0_g1_i2.p1  ORF type:complete len:797 (-),score=-27.02 TRINITY_DN16145_c0_g1_i2:238-2628(-)
MADASRLAPRRRHGCAAALHGESSPSSRVCRRDSSPDEAHVGSTASRAHYSHHPHHYQQHHHHDKHHRRRDGRVHVSVALLALLAVAAAVGTPRAAEAQALTYPVSATPSLADPTMRYRLRMFRYQSSIFNQSAGMLQVITFPTVVDWRADPRLAAVEFVRSEGACKSSWALTAVAAVEAAYAIAASSFPAMAPAVRLSAQQVVACDGTPSSCAGGWPTNALDYMAGVTKTKKGLVADAKYPFLKKAAACDKKKLKVVTDVRVAGYEQADFFGLIGFVLALINQPVIAFLRGSHPTFQSYGPSDGIYSDTACANGVIDHTVLVMGYAFSSGGAYFILRNSWGPAWGLGGYMNMSLAPGAGICGINTLPPLYPVVRTPSPCAGTFNPCGGGICNPVVGANGKTSYTCDCPLFYLNVTNTDGSPTCVLWFQCLFKQENPCFVGTCMDDYRGDHFCLCPPGFKRGFKPNGDETCVPTPVTPRSLTFPADVQCSLVYQIMGISYDQFVAQNPKLNGTCVTIPAKFTVNVTRPGSAISCSLYYTWQQSDTCTSVATQFSTDGTTLEALNPGISCDANAANPPAANQQICVIGGDGAVLPMCTGFYTSNSSETCDSIVAAFNISMATFLTLNPGLKCSLLSGPAGAAGGGGGDLSGAVAAGGGAEVCISGYLYTGASTPPIKLASHSLRALGVGVQQPTVPILQRIGFPATSGPTVTSTTTIPASAPPALRPPPVSAAARPYATVTPKARCLATYKVVQGDFCARITALKFNNSPKKMADLNNGYVCSNQRLYVGLVLCTKR